MYNHSCALAGTRRRLGAYTMPTCRLVSPGPSGPATAGTAPRERTPLCFPLHSNSLGATPPVEARAVRVSRNARRVTPRPPPPPSEGVLPRMGRFYIPCARTWPPQVVEQKFAPKKGAKRKTEAGGEGEPSKRGKSASSKEVSKKASSASEARPPKASAVLDEVGARAIFRTLPRRPPS